MGKEKNKVNIPGNFGYGDMPAEYRMKYKQMLEEHNNKEKKKKETKTKREQFAEKLYGGNKK